MTVNVVAGKGFKDPLTELAKNFSNETEIPINLIFTSYKKIVNFAECCDVIIAPIRYELFSVSPILILKLSNLIRDCRPFLRRVPVIVARSDSNISSLEDLKGKRLALINPEMHPISGGCLGIRIIEKSCIEANVIYSLPTDLVKDVLSGKADATILWRDSIDEERLKIIPIDDYAMDVYVATLSEKEEAKKFVDYLFANIDVFIKRGWSGLIE